MSLSVRRASSLARETRHLPQRRVRCRGSAPVRALIVNLPANRELQTDAVSPLSPGPSTDSAPSQHTEFTQFTLDHVIRADRGWILLRQLPKTANCHGGPSGETHRPRQSLSDHGRAKQQSSDSRDLYVCDSTLYGSDHRCGKKISDTIGKWLVHYCPLRAVTLLMRIL